MSDNAKATVIFDFDSVDQFVAANVITNGCKPEDVTFVDINTLYFQNESGVKSKTLEYKKFDEEFINANMNCRDEVTIFTSCCDNAIRSIHNTICSHLPKDNRCPDVISIYGPKFKYTDFLFIHNDKEIYYDQKSYSFYAWEYYNINEYTTDVPAAVRTIEAIRRFNSMELFLIDPLYFDAYKLIETYRRITLTDSKEYEGLIPDDFSLPMNVDLKQFVRDLSTTLDTICSKKVFDEFKAYVNYMYEQYGVKNK